MSSTNQVLPLKLTAKLACIEILLDLSEVKVGGQVNFDRSYKRNALHFLRQLETGCYTAVSDKLLKRMVDMYPEKLTNQMLVAMTPPHQRELKFRHCEKISLEGLRGVLIKCQNLKMLNLMGCGQFCIPAVFTMVTSLRPLLTAVSLEYCENLTDDSVKILLKNLVDLRHLNLSNCTELTDKVFLLNEELQLNKECSVEPESSYDCQLQSVNISCTTLTSTGIRHLSTLTGPTLQSVDISWTRVDTLSLLYLCGYSYAYVVDLALSSLNKEQDSNLFYSLLQLQDTLKQVKDKLHSTNHRKQEVHVTNSTTGLEMTSFDSESLGSIFNVSDVEDLLSSSDEEESVSDAEVGKECTGEVAQEFHRNGGEISVSQTTTSVVEIDRLESEEMITLNSLPVSQISSEDESDDRFSSLCEKVRIICDSEIDMDSTNHIKCNATQKKFLTHKTDPPVIDTLKEGLQTGSSLVTMSTCGSEIDLSSRNHNKEATQKSFLTHKTDPPVIDTLKEGPQTGSSLLTMDTCGSKIDMSIRNHKDQEATQKSFLTHNTDPFVIDRLKEELQMDSSLVTMDTSSLVTMDTVGSCVDCGGACSKCKCAVRSIVESASQFTGLKLNDKYVQSHVEKANASLQVENKPNSRELCTDVGGYLYSSCDGPSRVSDCEHSTSCNNNVAIMAVTASKVDAQFPQEDCKACSLQIENESLNSSYNSENICADFGEVEKVVSLGLDSQQSTKNLFEHVLVAEETSMTAEELSDKTVNYDGEQDCDVNFVKGNHICNQNGHDDAVSMETIPQPCLSKEKSKDIAMTKMYKSQIVSLAIENIKCQNSYNVNGHLCLTIFARENQGIKKVEFQGSELLNNKLLRELSKTWCSLREIKLSDCDNVTHDGILALGANCSELVSVDLQGINFLHVRDAAVFPLLRLKGLRNLNLAECEVTDRTLKRIANTNLDKLKELDLSWCDEVTEEGISYLCSKPSESINKLMLRLLPVTSPALRGISDNLQHLREISLSGVGQIDDAAVVYFSQNMRLLESVDISWNADISDEGVDALMKNCSRLRVAVLTGLKRLTSKPFLPLISDMNQWRRCQALLKLKLQERKDASAGEDLGSSSDEEYSDLYLPHRSTTYCPDLKDLRLEYCDRVGDRDLAEIVFICRKSIKIINYYAEIVVPELTYSSGWCSNYIEFH